MSEPSRKRGLPVRVKMRHEPHFVEELTARHETPVGKMVPLSTIEPDPKRSSPQIRPSRVALAKNSGMSLRAN